MASQQAVVIGSAAGTEEISNLNVTGNTTLGTDNTNTVTLNGVATFVNNAGFTGNITSINGVTTSWPSTQSAANRVLLNDGTGTLSWLAQASVGAAWSSLAAPTAALSLAMGNQTTTFTWSTATGAATDLFKFIDTANNTGTGYLVNIDTASGSGVKPFRIGATGTDKLTLNATGVLTIAGPTFSGTLIGTYTIGGTPTLGATLALNAQTLSGTATFSGAITFSSTINKITLTAPATGSTLTIADGKTITHNSTTTFAGTDGKTLTINNSLTLAGTDATTMTFPSTSGTVGVLNNAATWSSLQTFGTNISIGGTTATGATGTGSIVFASSPALVTPALGTPASGVLTNCSGTAASLTAGTVTTNANLTGPITSTGNATAIAAQTGTGTTFVMQASPTLTTPTLGVASATTINKVTLTTPATGSTITITDGKTLSVSNTLTFVGTDATTITFQGTDTYVGRATTDTLTNKTISAGVLSGTQTGTYTLGGTPTLGSTITFADAINIVLNATTGTKIGTATSQKLAFFNSTPIVQPTLIGVVLTDNSAGTGTADTINAIGIDTVNSAKVSDVRDALHQMTIKVNNIINTLKNLGISA